MSTAYRQFKGTSFKKHRTVVYKNVCLATLRRNGVLYSTLAATATLRRNGVLNSSLATVNDETMVRQGEVTFHTAPERLAYTKRPLREGQIMTVRCARKTLFTQIEHLAAAKPLLFNMVC